MTELLDIYNDNLTIIFNKINRLITIFTKLTIDKFELHSKDIEINLKEAEKMLKNIDLELITNSNLTNKNKIFYKKNYEIFKEKYEKSKRQFFLEKENFDYTKKKQDLINKQNIELNILNENKNNENNENYEKIQLQINPSNQIMANNSSNKLINAKLNLLKTENLSKNVMIDLEGNSQKINSSRMKMQNLDNNLDESNFFIKKLFEKDSRNKTALLTLAFTIASLLFYYMRMKV
jgi:hypothetical protein